MNTGHGPLEYRVGDGQGPLSRLLGENALGMAYQPIAELGSASIHAHEALVRGPRGMPLQMPDALFAAARRENLLREFEIACVVRALRGWSTLQQPGQLFVNISAAAMVRCFEGLSAASIAAALAEHAIEPRRVVFEITEHEHVTDVPRLLSVAGTVQAAGLRLALDDFGDGRSSLRLWSELAPDYVKIDKYFTADISRHAKRLRTLRALLQIAETFGSRLIAEGIETEDDLRVLRDLEVPLGQGFCLGRPSPRPAREIDAPAAAVLKSTRVAVLPAQRMAASPGRIVRAQILRAEAATPQTTCDEAARQFGQHEDWHALAFSDEDSRPLALLGRQRFLDRYSKPFFREIYGRKPAMAFANTTPTLLDITAEFEKLLEVLMSPDQSYLAEGFIYVDNGRYAGLGTGHQLVRQVTELRVEAARHANPLTLLPGNIPISEHIDRLCAAGSGFVACYADLANFKPFNDYYGYWRGDEVIKLVAHRLQKHCDPRRDFVGHVGGDDFVVLFQSSDWEARCTRMVEEFDTAAQALYDDDARVAGGIVGEDRHGIKRFFPFTTLYLGLVPVAPGGPMQGAVDVANAAAAAKQRAKRLGIGMYVHAADPPLSRAAPLA